MEMIIADLEQMAGRRYPARRWTRNIAGGASAIQPGQFAFGYVELEGEGGQVPWHNHEQEEVYFVQEGECEICLGQERGILRGGQAVFIPSGVFHQLTNVGKGVAKMFYVYGPAGEVAHWKQELAGTLPRAGEGETPGLPAGAREQCT